MKRILALILSVVMLFLLVACGNEKNAISNENTNSSTVQDSNVSSNNADNNTEDNSKNNTDNSSNAESTTSDTTKPTPPPSTPSDDFKENKDTVISETIINTPQKEDCKHKNMTYVPNEDGDVPTCTKSGYYLKWCPDCFVQIKVEAEALGHTGGTATCSSVAKCTRCQQGYGKLDTTKHINTSSRINNAKNPTCEEDGYEGDLLYCNDCKTTLEKGAVLKAKGHDLCQRWITKYTKYEVYCWYCNYSKITNINPIDFTFSDMGYEMYGFYPPSYDNPYFKIHVTGGYIDSYSKYKIECFRENGTEALHYVKSDGNTFSLEFHGYFQLGTAITIVVSDVYGNSQTKKITYVLDPTNERKLIFKEIK